MTRNLEINDVFPSVTPVFEWNFMSRKRHVINQGSTYSSKTYSILQNLALKAVTERLKHPITVTAQFLPTLKDGAIFDMANIIDSSPFLQGQLAKPYNKSDHYYQFKNGSIIHFKAFQTLQEAKAGKRSYLFVNEADGVGYEVFKQLEMRTTKQVFYDYNPTAEFWVHEKIKGKIDSSFFISTFKHNIDTVTRKTIVPQGVLDSLAAMKQNDPEAYRVYGRGLTGNLQGLIYPNWQVVDYFPERGKFHGYGVDFGYDVDPTALVEACLYEGNVYVSELLYKPGLKTPELKNEFRALGATRNIAADGAAGGSRVIAELNDAGIKSKVVTKPLVIDRINLLQGRKVFVTSWSKNLIKERKMYRWKKDKNGKEISEPVSSADHLLDALGYWAVENLPAVSRRGKRKLISA